MRINIKKAIKRWLLPFCTLLLIASGAVMPFGISRLQDAQAEKTVASRQFSPVSLTLQQQSELRQVLPMMPQEYSWFTYTGPTNLSMAEAVQAAQASLQAISESVMPLTLDMDAEVEVEMGLAVLSADNEASAILWICSFNNSFINDYTVFIDDKSGKMVKFASFEQSGVTYEYGIESANATADRQIVVSKTYAEKWQRFCQDYYGIEIVDIEEYADRDAQGYSFKYKFADDDTIYNLPLIFVGNNIVFN